MKYNQEEFCFPYKNIVLNAHQSRCEGPSTTLCPLSLASMLSHSLNTAYTAHLVCQNFGYTKISYMLETLYEIGLQRAGIPKNGAAVLWA